MENGGSWVEELVVAMTALDDCTDYVIVVWDRVSGEVDAYGPLGGADAQQEAGRLHMDFRARRMRGVTVTVVRLHRNDVPAPDGIGFDPPASRRPEPVRSRPGDRPPGPAAVDC